MRPRFRTHRGFPRNRAPRRPDRRPAVARFFSRTNAFGALALCSFSLTLSFFSDPTLPRSLCVIAGDISPIDVITHIPILCEEAGVPYIYVHSKEELGAAGQTKRPTSCMLVLPEAQKGGEKMSSDDASEFKDMYGKVVSKIKSLD